MPFEVTSRYLAAYIEAAQLNCSYFINQTTEDEDKRKKICEQFKFSSLDDVKTFLWHL